ncbi:GFA family protein [Duganella sp. PWIR1]
MTRSGGCYCGAVRYQVDGDITNKTTCHCQTCRRVSGAPTVSWFTVASEGFRLLSGSPAELRSSEHVTRTFCAACGTALTYRRDDLPQELDVTICSLDQPEAMAPADHTQTDYRLPWNAIADGLPQYPRSRSEGLG